MVFECLKIDHPKGKILAPRAFLYVKISLHWCKSIPGWTYRCYLKFNLILGVLIF